MSNWNSLNNRAVWFDIPVADLDRAATFYATTLGIKVHKERAGDVEFCLLEHGAGNGGTLVLDPDKAGRDGGPLLYLSAEGRIRDAVDQALRHGGRLMQAIHALGPHGVRAIVLDSEGNRIALHATTDS